MVIKALGYIEFSSAQLYAAGFCWNRTAANPKNRYRESRKKLSILSRRRAERRSKVNKEPASLEKTDISRMDYRKKVLISLRDAARPGRPINFTAEQAVQIIDMACEVKDASDSCRVNLFFEIYIKNSVCCKKFW